MLQVIQNLKSGTTDVVETPCPQKKSKSLLIQSFKSLISAGTERMLVEFGSAGYLAKAKQQPEKVKEVLGKIKTDGLLATYEAVKTKLDKPMPMGYCNVGKIIAADETSNGFKVGDRVVSNGPHAEYVSVPQNLCAKIPQNVSDEDAAFTVLGAIALQGIRLVQPTLGEVVVVSGLGMVGLMTVQLLKANGCRVIGLDYNAQRLALAKDFGAETINLAENQDPMLTVNSFTEGRGVDAVLITASTKSSEPVHQAAQMCRKRGRIVLVGVTGLELMRSDFYEKELTFQVSCSYGPGRYDSFYEEQGHDYPIGYVRWTEQRNFEAVLSMMAENRLNLKPLITHQFDIENAQDAYTTLANDKSSLGILLNYHGQENSQVPATTIMLDKNVSAVAGRAAIAFIGAGNYAGRILIPAFKKTQGQLMSIATSGSTSGVHYGRKYGFKEATSDLQTIYSSSQVNTVVIATQHNSHAKFVCEALNAGKHVFVEKPLCLSLSDLELIQTAYEKNNKLLMVGFNRRFSPHVQKIKQLLASQSQPKAFTMIINAGMIPSDHWSQNKTQGGGRILGEACHFIDLLRYLAGEKIVEQQIMQIGGSESVKSDKAIINLKFADGSIGSIQYLANGHKAVSKERLEVFCAGKILQLDNFRKLKGYGWPSFNKMNIRQNKGQNECAGAFVDAIAQGASSPISFAELLEVSRVTIELANQLD